MRSEPASGIPLIAILRGVVPERVVDVANVLYDEGIRMIEVPLNSPDPFTSIAALAACVRADWTIGAVTAPTADDERRTMQSGGRTPARRKTGIGQPASCMRRGAPGPILKSATHREHPFHGGVHCTSLGTSRTSRIRGSSTASVVHAWDLGGAIGAVNVSVPRS